MLNSKNFRWLGLFILGMLGLRLGYKYYRTQRKPDYQAQLQALAAKQENLGPRLRAAEDSARAAGFRPVRADSAV